MDHLLGIPAVQPGPADTRPTVTRVIARLYLPVEMGAFAEVLKALSRAYPNARLRNSNDPAVAEVEVTEPFEAPVPPLRLPAAEDRCECTHMRQDHNPQGCLTFGCRCPGFRWVS